jgi:hypothetical protein
MKKNRTYLVIYLMLILNNNLSAQNRGEIELVVPNGVDELSQGYALVIGEINYNNGWDQLKSIEKEIEIVKGLLEEHKFIVKLLIDKNSDELQKEIRTFLINYGNEENARLLVFFAGHGASLPIWGSMTGYIVPIDAPHYNNNERGFLEKAILISQFELWTKDLRCRHILFIFDSCFSGTIFTNRGEVIPRDISYNLAQPVRQFITAGSEKETTPSVSVLVPLLERALRYGEADMNKDGYISGTELGMYLQREIIKRYQGKWHPLFGKSYDPKWDQGDFIFKVINPKPFQPPPPPPPPPSPVSKFIGTWRATIEYNNSFDTYRINLIDERHCRVTVSNDNAEQETTGYWSWDSKDNTFSLEATFRNVTIPYLRNIKWFYRVLFADDKNSFRINGKPATNAPRNVLIEFNRE